MCGMNALQKIPLGLWKDECEDMWEDVWEDVCRLRTFSSKASLSSSHVVDLISLISFH